MLLIYAYDEGNAAASVVNVQDWVPILTIQDARSAWAAPRSDELRSPGREPGAVR
jgi:hypothetical protein